MRTDAGRAYDGALRSTIAVTALAWSPEPITEMVGVGHLQGAYLALPFAALLLVVRPRVGAWLVMVGTSYLTNRQGMLVLGLAVLGLRVAPSGPGHAWRGRSRR